MEVEDTPVSTGTVGNDCAINAANELLLLPLAGKRRRYKIAEDKSITTFVDYDDHERERFVIARMELWDELRGFAKPADMITLNAALSRQVDIEKPDTPETIDGEQLLSSEKGVEHMQIALAEMSCLLTLTGLLNAKEYFTYDVKNQLPPHHPNYRLSKGLQSRGIHLPNDQVVSIYHSNYAAASATLRAHAKNCRDSLLRRRLYLSGVDELRKYWRIVNIGGKLNSSRDPMGELIQITAVDTSYYSYGDVSNLFLSTSVGDKSATASNVNNDKLFTLELGPEGPVLSATELSKPACTLKLSFNEFSGNAADSTLATILASVDCWQFASSSGRNGVHSSVSALHEQLLRKQHDAFCRRLFKDIKQDAIAGSSRWILTPEMAEDNLETAVTPHSRSLLESLLHDNFLQSLDIHSVSAQQFSVLLSSRLSLVVSLVEISALTAPAVQSDVRTEQTICSALNAALCRAQCVLLHRFRLNLAVRSRVDEVQTQINNELARSAANTSAARDCKLLVQGFANELILSLKAPKLSRSHLRIDSIMRQQVEPGNSTEDGSQLWRSEEWVHRPSVNVGSSNNAVSGLAASGAESFCSGVLQSLLYGLRARIEYYRVKRLCRHFASLHRDTEEPVATFSLKSGNSEISAVICRPQAQSSGAPGIDCRQGEYVTSVADSFSINMSAIGTETTISYSFQLTGYRVASVSLTKQQAPGEKRI
jgi:hypothetical protein